MSNPHCFEALSLSLNPFEQPARAGVDYSMELPTYMQDVGTKSNQDQLGTTINIQLFIFIKRLHAMDRDVHVKLITTENTANFNQIHQKA